MLSEPFLPFTSQKLKSILRFDALKKTPHWNDMATHQNLIPENHQINPAELLFEKIEDEAVQKQLERLENTKKENQQAIAQNVEPQKETVSFEDFSKMDIRIGTILEAEKMPKADKLLVLKVDTGIDVRTIVSGISKSFTSEELIGKRVTVLANLAPRKLRGIESQGMILMVENAEGKHVFISPDEENISNGTTVK